MGEDVIYTLDTMGEDLIIKDLKMDARNNM
jgi:hypothetical protein